MILGFNEQFVTPILNDTKKHSFREDKHNRWKPGMIMQLATGARSKEYKQFAERTCTGTQDIEIKYTENRGAVRITIDGKHFGTYHRFLPEKSVNKDNVLQLVKNDGFEDLNDFLSWFKRDWEGKIIHWTDLRYG